MEEGQDREDAVDGLWMRIDEPDLTGIGGQVLVGEHRALWPTGGAAGILQQSDVVDRIDRDRRRILAMAQ